jgi:chromosomal replication initiation ATPase DnaA
LVLYLGRRKCGLKLKELGDLAGEMDYAAVSAAVKRFERRLARDSKLRRLVAVIGINIVEY